MRDDGLSPADLEQLRAHGIDRAEAERQLALLREPPPKARLARPCTAGDGIARLGPEEEERLGALFDRAAAAGRVTRMVPASGAASRMFRALARVLDAERPTASRPAPGGATGSEGGRHRAAEQLAPALPALEAAAAGGDAGARAVLEFVAGLDELALRDELAAALAAAGAPGIDDCRRSGDPRPLLATLLRAGGGGLGYADRPKGLIPFHRYGGGDGAREARTPFEEHLVEAAGSIRGRDGRCRLHFTVAPEHEAAFRELLARAVPRLESEAGARFEVGFSHQSPATDTLAVDPEGRPFREDGGALLLRPGGHGSVLVNLDALARGGADLVQLKNIDNVVPDRLRPEVLRWQRALGGMLVELEARAHGLLDRLEAEAAGGGAPDPALLAEAERFCAEAFGRPLPPAPPEARRAAVIDRLDRPLRVCGMVPNRGEPGGGPFWVDGRDGGVSRQIVEKAEIDLDDPGQAAILAAATHFNSVDLACALRDRQGHPYPLAGFADPAAVFIAAKSHQGRPLRALERPGLWNGGMARWNTVFVEVPAATFAPVKTVLDLLRPEHRAAR